MHLQHKNQYLYHFHQDKMLTVKHNYIEASLYNEHTVKVYEQLKDTALPLITRYV